MTTKTKAKTRQKTTRRCYIILDRSGSMQSAWSDTLGGLNSYLAELKDGTRVTVTAFDSVLGEVNIETVRDGTLPDIKQVTTKDIMPRGSTPLLDAVGTALASALAEHKKGDRVSVLVLTDGQENCSKEYTRDAVRKLVDAVQGNDWLITFLGEGVDAWGEAAKIGIRASSAATYTRANTRAAFGVSGQSVTAYFDADEASVGIVNATLSASDRRKLVG